MICPHCHEEIILHDTNTCHLCGKEVQSGSSRTVAQSSPPDPSRGQTFASVKKIKVNVGTRLTVSVSPNVLTTIKINAPEHLRNRVKASISADGVITIDRAEYSDGTQRYQDGLVLNHGQISLGGETISGNGYVGRNIVVMNGRVVNAGSVIGSLQGDIGIEISTPVDVNLEIDTPTSLHGFIQDLRNVLVNSSSACALRIGNLSNFQANSSGSLSVDIQAINGTCLLDVSGSCNFVVRSGHINGLALDSSGTTVLQVDALAESATIDSSGIITGRLRAKRVVRDISGRDNLIVTQ